MSSPTNEHSTPQARKILHLVGDAEDAGGVLSVIRNLQTASADSPWQHTVWVNRAYRETRQPALQYRYSDSVQAESSNHTELLRQARPATAELIALCEKESFDVIHAHSRGTLLVALLFAWKTKRDVIYTNHNYARSTRLYRWAAARKRMHTVVLTENMATHYGLRTDAPRVHQISACYADAFLERPLVPRPTTLPDRIRLVGVGSVIGWKKWDLVVEALHRLAPEDRTRFEFHVWGPTLQFPEAKAFAERLNQMVQDYGLTDQVIFQGSTTDVIGKLMESHFFLLPSTNEPCSVALMEALSLGLPVIVSQSGGNVNIVQDQCGLKFVPDDPDSLKSCLESLLKEGTRFRPPEAIRDTVRHRCASQVFQDYERLYTTLISE